MSWTEFLKILSLMYAAYYAFFTALDNFRKSTTRQRTDQPLVLSFPAEQPKIAALEYQNELPPTQPPSAGRDWQDDIPEQDPEDVYEELDDIQGNHEPIVDESSQGSISLLASGITDFSGGISLSDLYSQILEENIELIGEIYTKHARS